MKPCMLWGTTFMFQQRTQMITSNSGIERIFEQECVLDSNDQRPCKTWGDIGTRLWGVQ
jgi:hypothetical protein